MPVVVAPGLALLSQIQVEQEVTWNQGGVYYAGRIRAITPRDEWRADYIELDIECQDYTSLLNDEICTSARSVVETDAQRISWLLQSFDRRGISAHNVQTLYAAMPTQDFTGMTLNDAIKAVLAFSNGGFYVDYFKDLHTFIAESLTAPFALSDNPDNVTSFGYNNFQYPQDSVDLRNAVYGIPSTTVPVTRPDSGTVTITTSGGLDGTGPIILASFKPITGLRIAQVGALGAFTIGSTTTVSPTFAQATGAGHFLVAWAGPGGSIPTTTQAGWIQAVGRLSLAGGGYAIWYKPASGASETAPTFTATAGAGPINAQLAEFSGVQYGPLEQTASNDTFSNPQTAAATAIDAAIGNLVVMASGWDLTNPATSTFAETFTNGAPTVHAGDSGYPAQRFPASFSYGIIPLPAQPTWYTDETSIATFGRREASLPSSSTTAQSALDALGVAYITAHSNPLKHSSLLLPPGSPVGLTAGQTINLTNSLYGLTAQPFRIQSVDTTYPADDKPQFAVQFADPMVTTTIQMVALQSQIDSVNSKAQTTAATVAGDTRGTLGYAQVVASQTGISAEVDLTGLSVTVTIGAGRRIRISSSVRVQQQTSAASPIVNLKEASTVLELDVAPLGIGNQATLKPSAVLTPSAGSHTYKLSLQTGAGTVDAVGQAQSPLWIAVEDIGI